MYRNKMYKLCDYILPRGRSLKVGYTQWIHGLSITCCKLSLKQVSLDEIRWYKKENDLLPFIFLPHPHLLSPLLYIHTIFILVVAQ